MFDISAESTSLTPRKKDIFDTPIFKRKKKPTWEPRLWQIFGVFLLIILFISIHHKRSNKPLYLQQPTKKRSVEGVTSGSWSQKSEVSTKTLDLLLYKFCADQYNLCECDGIARFGKGKFWTYMEGSGKIACTADSFENDPIPGGVNKQCECKSDKEDAGEYEEMEMEEIELGGEADETEEEADEIEEDEAEEQADEIEEDEAEEGEKSESKEEKNASAGADIEEQENESSNDNSVQDEDESEAEKELEESKIANITLGNVFSSCAKEENEEGGRSDSLCECEGVVRFGSGEAWMYQKSDGSVICSVETFGRNPIKNQEKECQCLSKDYALNKHVANELHPIRAPCLDSNGVVGYNLSHEGFWRPYMMLKKVDTDQECAAKCTFDGSCFAFSRSKKDNSCYVYTSATIEKDQKQVAKDNIAYTRCLNANNSFVQQNLIFIRPKKVGSSTFSGVVRRIGAHYGLSGHLERFWEFGHEPGLWANHELRYRLSKRLNRLKMHTFFISLVRDPIPRCLSYINHVLVTRGEKNMTTKAKIRTFKSDSMKPKNEGCFAHYKKTLDPENQKYDFIAITERFDESLVVLKNLLHLNYNDILYLSAKVAGHVDEYGFKIHRYKKYEEEDQELKDFVEKEWRFTNPDFWIYRNAKLKLDEHIESIPDFQEQLNIFQDMLKDAQEACSDYYLKDCYFSDHGCGHTCLDMQLLESTS